MATKKPDWTPVKKDPKGMPCYEIVPRATPPNRAANDRRSAKNPRSGGASNTRSADPRRSDRMRQRTRTVSVPKRTPLLERGATMNRRTPLCAMLRAEEAAEEVGYFAQAAPPACGRRQRP